MDQSTELTQLLHQWQQGDEAALEALTPVVYDELRRLARSHMRRENPRHTLQATALVNEAFIKLIGAEVNYSNRAHFFSTAARIMRRVLVDHARSRQRAKRGGKQPDVTFDDAVVGADSSPPDILDLDLALDKLAASNAKLADAVELVYFGGLTYEEAAEQFGVSRSTFFADLQFARAWLQRELG
ncbi:MAG: ECF-type sigma factor [Woeseiaceae bacterium]|nr:ECF-type sigma factor [Woeseiaceae bacterium]